MSSVTEASAKYVMPRVSLGDMVRFWPDGARSDSRGEIGTVFGVGQNGRTVSIRIMSSGQCRYGVRHLSDPRINENQEVRAEGAWEYSQLHNDLDALRTMIMEQGREITKLQNELAQIKSRKTS